MQRDRTGVGEGAKIRRGKSRFLVRRQGFIKKIPLWNEWLGIHIYLSFLILSINPSQLDPNS